MRTFFVLLAMLALALGGCEAKKEETKKDDGKKAAKEAPAGTEKEAPVAGTEKEAPAEPVADAPAATGLRLEQVGLTIELPSTLEVSNAIGETGAMIMGGEVGAMTVSVAAADAPATLAAKKEDVEMYGPQNIQEETLADGWILSFTNEGGVGTNYWVHARREIGGKAIHCSTMCSTADQQKAVIAACKTLKP